jgi:uncharacterized protein YndB with AHSA1/START domain
MSVTKITVEVKVNAPIDHVWACYTTPDDILQWNAASADWHTTAARVDLREGGEFCSRMEAKDGSFGFDFEGRYTKIIAQQLIEYAFGDRQAKVEFENAADQVGEPLGDAGNHVKVRVTFEAETTHSIQQQQDGWQAILNNFAKHAESTHLQMRSTIRTCL